MATHLEELVGQVRRHTIEVLQATPEEWLLWAPEGTSNHVLWHAGHALWLEDVLGIQVLTGVSELPAGWEQTFGSKCRPVQSNRQWPRRTDVIILLQQQLVRLLDVFRDQAHRLANAGIASRVIHGLHDEARHSGEMYLLLKLRRARIA
jgi:hypothetical protein